MTTEARVVALVRGQEGPAEAALAASHSDYPAFCALFPDRTR